MAQPASGNGFTHACFISYKHPPREALAPNFYQDFVRALRERIEYYLQTEIRTYLDEDADPGTSYPTELSQSLCRSVCLVAVLTPEYFDSSWCKAEWDAMIELEGKRVAKAGLIIPVVLRGDVHQWENAHKRKPFDLRVDVTGQLKGVKKSKMVREIAELIANLVQSTKDLCTDCRAFRLAVEQAPDVLATPSSYKDPNMLAG